MLKQSTFKPARFLSHPHLQTLFPSLTRKLPNIYTLRQRLELPDGDFVDLLWSHEYQETEQKPLVILFHGLTGSYKSSYIQGMMRAIEVKGWCGVLMHFRGCSGTPNRLARSYHSGETGDARYFIKYLHQRYPKAKLFACGYSLGGNMLLKLQGELGENSDLIGASATCAPLNLTTCANEMNSGFSRFYQWVIMRDLRKALHMKFQHLPMHEHIDCKRDQIDNLDSFWSYDACYTAPIHGFKSAQEYYELCSGGNYLKAIQKPTLVIQAKDDPFMNASVIPGESEISDAVVLEISEHGGHVGYISGSIFKPVYWLEKRILDYFESLL